MKEEKDGLLPNSADGSSYDSFETNVETNTGDTGDIAVSIPLETVTQESIVKTVSTAATPPHNLAGFTCAFFGSVGGMLLSVSTTNPLWMVFAEIAGSAMVGYLVGQAGSRLSHMICPDAETEKHVPANDEEAQSSSLANGTL